MEMEDWERLWNAQKKNVNYVMSELSDGDSKGIAAVQRLGLYEVQKEECVNYVAKRLGTALMQAKKMKKLGGRVKGTLTQDKIMRLADYFRKFIKQVSTVEDMKMGIYATLCHC